MGPNVSKFAYPSTGPLLLAVRLPFSSNISCRVFDVSGKPVWTQYFEESRVFFDEIPRLNPGVYFAEIVYLGGMERYRIIFN